MKTNPFKRFDQVEVLSSIESRLLYEFIQRFEPELKAAKVPLPDPNLGEADYAKAVHEFLVNWEVLPETMIEALLAIEEMASPEQSVRRETIFWESPEELWIDGKSSPENVALHLWLLSPYKRNQPAVSAPAPSPVPPPLSASPGAPVGSASEAARQAAYDAPYSESNDSCVAKPQPLAPPPAIPKVKSSGHRRNGKVACLS